MAVATAAKRRKDPQRASGQGPLPQEQRRQELIDATIEAIATYGLSRTTLAKVAGLAGLTAGSVNFHFTSKEALLLETLRFLAEEFGAAMEEAIASAGTDPGESLLAVIDAYFTPQLWDPRKVAVWYAFWGEAQARNDYQKFCGEQESAALDAVHTLCQQIIDEGPHPMDAGAIARSLIGLLESLWQDILVAEVTDHRESARRTCQAYLASVFPWRFKMPGWEPGCAPDGDQPPVQTGVAVVTPERQSLSAWVYNNQELFELELAEIHRPAWQVVCHVNEIAEPGAYCTLDVLGERAFVIRGKDDRIRAFHNVCRHRAHAVVDGEGGTCPGVIHCPYHGWSYDLDGALKAVPSPQSFSNLDRKAYGLKALDLEIFMGFVFVRFESRGPSVAQRFNPFVGELSYYRLAEMQPVDGLWQESFEVDWKNIWDNYLEDYHFPTGHPGLFALMERDFDREIYDKRVARLGHRMREAPARHWSAQHYRGLIETFDHLPESMRIRWSYLFLYPGLAFDLYPDKIDFFQVVPEAPGRSRVRCQSYALPDTRRETHVARYLNLRINRLVQREDNRLTRSVQLGLGSSSYTRGLLCDQEIVLQAFQTWLGEDLPVARLDAPPPTGTLAQHNLALGDRDRN